MKAKGLTLVAVVSEQDGEPLGLFGLADEIRPESRATVAALHEAGVKHTVMLTGDHAQSAKQVADAVGVTDWFAQLLPQQKVGKIKELAAKYKVAMVGDGINDAPALASAQLGIAMGKGTDSAVETADIVLMQDHLGKLPNAIRISKHVNRIIRWNIGIALGEDRGAAAHHSRAAHAVDRHPLGYGSDYPRYIVGLDHPARQR